MNWEAAGAVGELIGAFAVVATLIYLAIQIRENTRASKSEAFRDSVALWNDVFEMLATADSEIVMKALVSYQSLEGHEKHQFETPMIAALAALEAQLDILGHEFMDEDVFLSVEGFLRRYFAYEGTHDWWKSGRESCAPIVKAWIDNGFQPQNPNTITGESARLNAARCVDGKAAISAIIYRWPAVYSNRAVVKKPNSVFHKKYSL